MGLYSGRGAYIRVQKRFKLQSVKHFFLSFLQYKARISGFFTSCKMRNMFKVYNKNRRIRKINEKVKNKDTVDVVLASLLLTFNFLLHCFHCWLWSVSCRLGLFLLFWRFVPILCATSYNKFQVMEKLGK